MGRSPESRFRRYPPGSISGASGSIKSHRIWNGFPHGCLPKNTLARSDSILRGIANISSRVALSCAGCLADACIGIQLCSNSYTGPRASRCSLPRRPPQSISIFRIRTDWRFTLSPLITNWVWMWNGSGRYRRPNPSFGPIFQPKPPSSGGACLPISRPRRFFERGFSVKRCPSWTDVAWPRGMALQHPVLKRIG